MFQRPSLRRTTKIQKTGEFTAIADDGRLFVVSEFTEFEESFSSDLHASNWATRRQFYSAGRDEVEVQPCGGMTIRRTGVRLTPPRR